MLRIISYIKTFLPSKIYEIKVSYDLLDVLEKGHFKEEKKNDSDCAA